MGMDSLQDEVNFLTFFFQYKYTYEKILIYLCLFFFLLGKNKRPFIRCLPQSFQWLEETLKHFLELAKHVTYKILIICTHSVHWTVQVFTLRKEKEVVFVLDGTYCELSFGFCHFENKQWRKLTQQVVKTATNVYPLGYVLWRELPTQNVQTLQGLCVQV